MKRSHATAVLATALATLLAAAFAATAGPAAAGSGRPTATANTGVLHVGFAVQRFVKHGTHLVAIGRTISTITTDSGTYTSIKPFTSVVTRKATRAGSIRTTQQAQRICNVLNLNLGPVHLALLGLIVDLSPVNLTITADSNGGLLGSLLCGLAGGGGGILGTATNAAKLTNVAQTSGLSLGPGYTIPVSSAIAGSAGTQSSQAVCTVLDLTLGPLDLNLLGLMVHLNQVHLLVTADPTGGLLGSLLCSLAGGAPTG
ncbi:MAG TPA: hypothetical protein VI408_06350 [Gaiellaceae bacterium]